MGRRLLSLLLLLLPATAPIPARADDVTTVPIVSNHDFDSGTATYCLLGLSQDSVARGLGNIKTTGSSATVDAATGTPFSATAPGDEITVKVGSNPTLALYILTEASTSQITVDRAVDLSGAGTTGYPWTFRNLACGTGAGAGWFGVSQYTAGWTLFLEINQLSIASGSVAVTVQCKGPSAWAQPIPVYPDPADSAPQQCHTGLFTTAGLTARCAIDFPPRFSSCRLGVALTDDGGDTGANLEQITASITGQVSR